MAQPLTLIGPDGLRYDFDPDAPNASLEAAQAKGYRLETEEEPRTWTEAAKAGVTRTLEAGEAAAIGALEGATFGLTKPLTEKYEATAPEEYPVAKGIGEFAGMLLSPANEVAAIGKAVKVGRLVEAGIGGAAIGALSGAGATVGEHLAGDSELNGEKLAMSMGLGALLGTGGGLVGEGIIMGAEKVAPALKDIAGRFAESDDFLKKWRDEQWVKHLSGVQGASKKVEQEMIPEVANVAREFQGAGSIEEMKEAMRVARNEAAEAVAADAGVDLGGYTTDLTRDEARSVFESNIDRHLGTWADETLAKAEQDLGVNFQVRHADDAEAARQALRESTKDARKIEAEEVTKAFGEKYQGLELGGMNGEMDNEAAKEAVRVAQQKSTELKTRFVEAADAANRPVQFEPFMDMLSSSLEGMNSIELRKASRTVDEILNELGRIERMPANRQMSALEHLKVTLHEDTNWGQFDSPLGERIRKQILYNYRELLDANIAERIGPEMAEAFQNAKQSYGVLADAREVLRRKANGGAEFLRSLGESLEIGAERYQKARTALNIADEALAAVQRKTSTGRDALEVIAKRAQPNSPRYADAVRNAAMSEIGFAALRKQAARPHDALRAIAAEAGLDAASLTRFRALTHAEDLLEAQIKNRVKHRSFSLTSYLTALATGARFNTLTGLATLVGHQWLRDNGSKVVAQVADKIAASKHLEAIASGFAKQMGKNASMMGEYAPALQEAAKKGPATLLALHMVMAQADPQYQQAAAAAGFAPEDADTHQASMVRAHAVAQLKAAAQDADQKLHRHVERILKGDRAPPSAGGGADFGNKAIRKSAVESHDKRADEILALANDPEAMVERIASNLGNFANVAPGTAASMSATAMRAVQHLVKVAAKPAQAGPLAPAWAPSEQEKAKFARVYHAVVDPESVLQHAASGTMTRDEMQALEAVYPRLVSHLKEKMLDRLTDGPTVPYQQRLMIGMLLGASADGSSSAKAIVANQQAIRAQPKQQEAPGGAATPARADKLNVANRFATAGERREMERN
jgi:hypothetical protein